MRDKGALIGIVAILPTILMAEPVTIAAMGDSLTHGYGLPPEDGFVPQLEAWLAVQGAEVTLINAGVSGDTTAGGLSRVAWTLTPEVDAVIVSLGANDFLRAIDPAATRSNLEGIVQAAKAAGVEILLVGMQAPGNYGPDYKAAFDQIYPDLASAYDTLFLPSFFAGFGEGTPAEFAPLLQSDGLHPNAAGVAKIVEGFGPSVLELVAQARD